MTRQNDIGYTRVSSNMHSMTREITFIWVSGSKKFMTRQNDIGYTRVSSNMHSMTREITFIWVSANMHAR
jgi:DNA segregation ATPase FtsK/SpoIIIE-like protein